MIQLNFFNERLRTFIMEIITNTTMKLARISEIHDILIESGAYLNHDNICC